MARDAMQEHWSLYEAYNELHGLALELEIPLEEPAVLAVGHQTDGKSALVDWRGRKTVARLSSR